ncbi:IclR family transcriptional regulator [Microlunatus panaciterrae]|uniref:DNA-binding IclR family transcriptional regulator n=1 Tax=Microlunatus panaciterrae TaxID=400768 RepID=A0ABS2RHL2_9ACTN|nr:IclR family transcriptional regulator [Microlunatus panaciterrae]MBM7797686.1 DNA-binding IclR family transcriptional regulator [Microlunatus panaciterrae]
MTSDGSPANGVSRVLAILQSVAEHPDGMTVGQVAREFGAPKSSVHRALAALVRSGLVRQDADARYHLGFLFLRLAFGYQSVRQSHLDVEDVLRSLADEFGETTHYGALIGSEIVYQAKVAPRNASFQMTSVVGGTNPAYCTGLGKAILMHELIERADVQAFVDAHGPLAPRTQHTLTTVDSLYETLRTGRERGYAMDLEENEIGINCIAFPLFLDSPFRPTGAISISGVRQRIDARQLQEAAPRIRAVIEGHLGDVLHPAALADVDVDEADLPLPRCSNTRPEMRKRDA